VLIGFVDVRHSATDELPKPPSSPILWTQFLADGREEQRSIYELKASRCPEGSSARQLPSWATGDFDIQVCSRPVQQTPLIINRIVVIGDTGCRMKGSHVQNCDKDWPFRRIADQAAQKHPDLVIHVGDYLYRETCPNNVPVCAPFHVGNQWKAWQDDFFTPARNLLAAAPWVFVRGNHEACGRAGAEGWIRLLSPDANGASDCPITTSPYLLQLGNLDLLVADNSADPNNAPTIRSANDWPFADRPAGGTPIWMLVHGPFRSLDALSSVVSDPSRVDLIISGHVHEFAFYGFKANSPPQLIIGNGGTEIERGPLHGHGLQNPIVVQQFGYALILRDNSQWTATLYSVSDEPIAQCALNSKSRCSADNR
jgi:predicted phosphodiesterase